MPRVPKHGLGEVAQGQTLTVELAATVLGGCKARDPYDSALLREASNLVARACTHLGLKADYAITPARVPAPHVELAFVHLEDMRSLVGVAWPPKRDEASVTLILDEGAFRRLLKVAGPPDNKGRERRSREKQEAFVETFSLRWSWVGGSGRDR